MPWTFLPSSLEPTLALLLSLFVKGALILSAAGLVAYLLRASDAATRFMVWATAVAGVVLLPVLATLVPSVPVPLPDFLNATVVDTPTAPAPSLTVTPSPEAPVTTWTAPAAPRPPVEPMPVVAPAPTAWWAAPLHWLSGLSLASLLLIVWLTGLVAVAVRMLVAYLGVDLMVRRSARVDEDDWHLLAEDAAQALGVERQVRLRWSSWTAVPLCVGLRRPTIVLPLDAHTWSPERRRVVLLHEMAHIKRRDSLTQLLAHVACAVHWPNPLVWVAARQLQMERECACDDAVLRAGTRPTDYAATLLDTARRLKATPWPTQVALAIARPSQLEGRLLSILDENRPRRALNRVGRLLTVAVVVTLVLPLSALTAVPTLPEAGAWSPPPPAFPEPPAAPAPAPTAFPGPTTVSPPPIALETIVPDTFAARIRAARTAASGVTTYGQLAAEAGHHAATGRHLAAEAAHRAATTLHGAIGTYGTAATVHGTEGPVLLFGDSALESDVIPAEEVVRDVVRDVVRTFGGQAYVDDQPLGDSLSVDELITLRRYGVDGAFIQGFRDLGYTDLTVSEVTDLARYGVRPDFVAELQAAGLTDLTVREVTRFARYGVDLDLIRRLQAEGYVTDDAEALVDVAKHGVSASLIDALRASGYTPPDLDTVVDLSKYGVDAAFLTDLRETGYGSVALDEVIRFSKYGVCTSFITGLQARGYDGLSPDDLIDARKYGVDLEMIDSLRQAELTDLTVDELVELRKYGVDADYVREVREAGLRDVTADQLVDLKKHGVDGDFIRSMRDQ
ncbi:MAG: M56 family metallopeptidase [Bacteroidota bacterium]